MSRYFKLRYRTPVPIESILDYSKAFGGHRRVRLKRLSKDVHISTVFLGLNHSVCDGEPLLFESMVFTHGQGGYTQRCSTWRQALYMHKAAVAYAKKNST